MDGAGRSYRPGRVRRSPDSRPETRPAGPGRGKGLSLSAEDLILCAITSQIPEKLSKREVLLEAKDMANERLPKRSMVKVGKLFTMHRSLVAARFGALKEEKLLEVLDQLRTLFTAQEATHSLSLDTPGDIDI